jgi:hypothetical protein
MVGYVEIKELPIIDEGSYKAEVFSAFSPERVASFPPPDFVLVWKVLEGKFKDRQVNQKFRLEKGDEVQNRKGQEKLNEAILSLFGYPKKDIKNQEFIGRSAIIEVKKYEFEGKEGSFVSGTKPIQKQFDDDITLEI